MYFFDSYAIIELMKNNPNYDSFKDLKIITSVMNVGEVYNIILREKDKAMADEWFKNVNFELLEISSEFMVDAVYFRHINKNKNVSSTDAVGYTLSLKHKLKFLTGDKQFEKMPNVEFVR